MLVAAVACFGAAFAGAPPAWAACTNEALRTGASGILPDCRAYELVTPRDTNYSVPIAATSSVASFIGAGLRHFASSAADGSGNGFVFGLSGTTLPGTEGGGFINAYRAERSAGGWASRLIGPTGQQAAVAQIGGFAADQGYLAVNVVFLENRFSGSLALREGETAYLRTPDGSFELVGEGTLPEALDEDGNPNGLADELHPRVRWISPEGRHVIFSQGNEPVRLLPASPAAGVSAIYDRTPSGLRLLSVLPGGEAAPGNSGFEGASEDGSTVLFRTGGALFARLEDSRTVEVRAGEPRAAGISEDGAFVFFVEGAGATGNLFRYDTRSGDTKLVAGSGDSRFVNVAPDGSRVYFESPSVLVEGQGTGGAPNLYAWDSSGTRFVATLAESDLGRMEAYPAAEFGLAQWVGEAADTPARNGDVVLDTSRVSTTGRVFAFESSANLAGVDTGGQIEIYHYDDVTGSLVCVSCAQIAGPPAHGSYFGDYGLAAIGPNTVVGNLSADGRSVFFQSDEPLVGRDINGTTDVYEWREGNLSLISTGQSSLPSLLMGATPDGEDVFFQTAEQLVPAAQQEGVPAIYDARVGGGFPEQGALSRGDCTAVACRPLFPSEGTDPEPTSTLPGSGRRRGRGCAHRHRHHNRHHHVPFRCRSHHRHHRHNR